MLYLTLLLMLLAATPNTSFACRNKIAHPTLEEHCADADGILSARVVSVDTQGSFQYSITLEALHWWRGRIVDTLIVQGRFSSCSENRQPPKPGQTIIAFLTTHKTTPSIRFYDVLSNAKLPHATAENKTRTIVETILGKGITHFNRQAAPFSGTHIPQVYASREERACTQDQDCSSLPGVCNATVLAVNRNYQKELLSRIKRRQMVTSCRLQKDTRTDYSNSCVDKLCILRKKP